MRPLRAATPASAPTTATAAPPPLPSSYRRLVARVPAPTFRDAVVLQEVAWSPPAPGEVSVRIVHAGVNGGCETFRARAERGTPFAAAAPGSLVPLGAEGAGVVAAVGDAVTSLAVGDAVVVSGGAAFAEYVSVPPSACLRVSAPTPAVTAAVLSGTTAVVALDATAGGVGPEDTVLVTAAAGGTGQFAVQAAAAAGARVIAVVGGPAKAAAVEGLLGRWPGRGDHVVLDRLASPPTLAAAIAAAAGAAGVTIAYEGVGGALRGAVLDALAPGGRLLCVGYMGGYPHAASSSPSPSSPAAPGLPPDRDLFWGRGRVDLPDGRAVIGDVWGGGDRRAVARARRKVVSAVDGGEWDALIDAPMHTGLEAAADAVERLLSGASIGKVVLRVG